MIFACFGLADLELGHLQLGPDRQDIGLPDHARLEEPLVAVEELADALGIGLAEFHRQGRGDGIDVDRVEVVDRVADGVLELGLGDLPGRPGPSGSARAA